MEVLTVQATAADLVHQLTSLWVRAVIRARYRWAQALILAWEVQALVCLEAQVQAIQAWAVRAQTILAWGVQVRATI